MESGQRSVGFGTFPLQRLDPLLGESGVDASLDRTQQRVYPALDIDELTLDADALTRAVVAQLAHQRGVLLAETRDSVVAGNIRREEAVDQLEEYVLAYCYLPCPSASAAWSP